MSNPRRVQKLNGSLGCRCRELVVALDDADGRMLYARCFAQEGTASTFTALEAVLRQFGRFCELYTNCGQSRFCYAESKTDKSVERYAHSARFWPSSPQARGRNEASLRHHPTLPQRAQSVAPGYCAEARGPSSWPSKSCRESLTSPNNPPNSRTFRLCALIGYDIAAC